MNEFETEHCSRSAEERDRESSEIIRITGTKKMPYFLLIYFNIKPLHVSSRLAVRHQEDQLCMNNNWYSHALY
jgi:hypothetical protein